MVRVSLLRLRFLLSQCSLTSSIKIAIFDSAKHSRDWDRFISDEAVNASFIHSRKYIGYHGEKFYDFSLVFTINDRIIAVVPAIKIGETVLSHPGLTFGGILIGKKCRHSDIATIINLAKLFLKEYKIEHIYLTQPPYIYQSHPADDISYLLTTSGASLTRRRLLSVVDLTNQSEYSTLRKRGVKKANNNGLKVDKSKDFTTFYTILAENLATRYAATPIHTFQEIEMLSNLFPDNIRLYMTFDSNKAIAGAVVYTSRTVFKTQYIASTAEGRNLGAVDLLLTTIIKDARKECKRYVDFGSSEDAPNKINPQLLFQKEGFGSRGVCLDTYTLDL